MMITTCLIFPDHGAPLPSTAKSPDGLNCCQADWLGTTGPAAPWQPLTAKSNPNPTEIVAKTRCIFALPSRHGSTMPERHEFAGKTVGIFRRLFVEAEGRLGPVRFRTPWPLCWTLKQQSLQKECSNVRIRVSSRHSRPGPRCGPRRVRRATGRPRRVDPASRGASPSSNFGKIDPVRCFKLRQIVDEA